MSALLDHLLEPIEHAVKDVQWEELCVNSPSSIYIYSAGKFSPIEVPGLDYDRIEEIAWSAAAQRRMDINEQNPILDTDVMGRGRLFACVYPAVEEGRPCLTVRQEAPTWPTYEELDKQGMFRDVAHVKKQEVNPQLVEFYKTKNWGRFFPMAAAEGLNILNCGLTASGKTHAMKAGIRAIKDPNTRVVTVQNTNELKQLESFFRNSVQLLYASIQTDEGPGAAALISAAMRMRPERLILQEIRTGEEALAYTYALQTGHPGMSTIHAPSCRGAFKRLQFIIKQTPAGAAIEDTDLMDQLEDLIDVVVHFSRVGKEFAVDEVWFRHATQGHSSEQETDGK